MIKKILNFKTVGLVAMLCFPLMALAVTQKEMEQARTIAAKAYIRYANDGSGYLDDINPSTMEELEAALKTKEKENIKAFKAIPVPTDYKDWNKDKLVEYWAVTAFQNKGLLEKGRGGRIRARSQINKMTIAPPQPETPVAVTPASAPSTSSPQVATNADSTVNTKEQLSDLKADEEAIVAAEENLEEEEANVDQAYNYTWVYIMVLAILVAIAVALIVYASNVMKKKAAPTQDYTPRSQENSEELDHYKSMVADKDSEISMLKKKLESATKQNSDLKTRLENLTAEVMTLKATRTTVSPEIHKQEEAPEPVSTKPMLRTIYLGRANMKGVFVRADRTLNPGHSIFVLDTSDGFSGSFRLADASAAWSLALSNPREYLATACTGHDLDDTTNVSRIVTESAGTAVFEGGCWRVIRKARIRYE